MNTDIRTPLDLPNHPKFRLLKRDLGPATMEHLIALWCYVAARRPSGTLTGLSPEEIAVASNWDGDPDHFVGCLVKRRWIDSGPDGTLSCHDWAEHQPWIVGSTARSEAASLAARAKHAGRTKPQTAGTAESCEAQKSALRNPADRTKPQGNRTAESCEPSAPSPSPSPLPNPSPINPEPPPDSVADPPATAAGTPTPKVKSLDEWIAGNPGSFALCTELAEGVQANGHPAPTIGIAWIRDARLLCNQDRIRGEPITVDTIREVMAWALGHGFWRQNIRSMPTFREKFSTLKLAMEAEQADERSKARGRTRSIPGNHPPTAGGAAVIRSADDIDLEAVSQANLRRFGVGRDNTTGNQPTGTDTGGRPHGEVPMPDRGHEATAIGAAGTGRTVPG